MGFRATDGPRVRMFKKRVTLSLPPLVYDLILIGGGPAGLTAGVYARTRKLSTLILEAQAIGGQLEWLYPTKSVYDYPSYIAIEGGELAQLFVLHSRESGAELRSEEVVDIERQPSGFRVRTREGHAFETRTITPLPKWGIELEGERLIKVKADMSTSVRGIYACGDIVSYPGKDKRIVTGCGEAVTAIMSVYKYLKQPYWA